MGVGAGDGGNLVLRGERRGSRVFFGGTAGIVGFDEIDAAEELIIEFMAFVGMRENDEASLAVNGFDDLPGVPRANFFLQKNADDVAFFTLIFRGHGSEGRISGTKGVDGERPFDGVVIGDDETVDSQLVGAREDFARGEQRIEGVAGVEMKQAAERHELALPAMETAPE